MYPEVKLYIDGEWVAGSEGKSEPILDPATAQPIGDVPHASRADLDRALAAARSGFEAWRASSAYRALQAHAQGRRPPARARRRDRHAHDAGAGQAARRSEGRDAARRRHHRLVRRGRPPHLWPRHPGARRGRVSARDQGAGRPGRRVHAVELPDQPGGAQALGARSPPAAR